MNDKPDLERYLVVGVAIVAIFVVVVALAVVTGLVLFGQPQVSAPQYPYIVTNL